MLTVKILGAGCANCKRVEQLARKTVLTMGLPVEVQKITDVQEILAHGVLATPGLVIGEQLVCSGRIPTEAEITVWLTSALEVGG